MRFVHSLALAASLLPLAQTFSLGHAAQTVRPCRGERRMAVTMDQLDEEPMARGTIEAMRVKQIKLELDKLGVAHDDAFEKEDLVQRLLDAKDSRQADSPLTMDQTQAGMDMVMNDVDGQRILEEMKSNKRLMDAAMDIASNGFSDKYEGDEEVMDFMRRLEAISKRQA